MATITTEKRKRGFFGWIFAALFWLWQVAMAAWWISSMNLTSDQYAQAGSEAERTGTAVGATIVTYMILSMWAAGSLILGMMMFFTRGRKTTVTREIA